jgi:hypothetical protein
MKTVLASIAVLGAAFAAAAAGAPTASLPPSTDTAVGALTARENAVVAQLKLFPKGGSKASLAHWETSLKAAQAAQTKAAATLNADLSSAPAKTTSTTTTTSVHLGATLSFQDTRGDPYTVQLVKLIDPAKGADELTTPDPGHRFVAAVFKITNTGKRRISDDANSNASITGSNGQTFLSDPDTVAECTNFTSGTYQLAPGQSLSGCVVFQPPRGIDVSQVDWSPGGRFIAGFQAWDIS